MGQGGKILPNLAFKCSPLECVCVGGGGGGGL